MQEPRDQDLLAVYQTTVESFRTLTEIRFKLLTFLPLGTGLGVALSGDAKGPALSAFGALVTLALWVYDQRNNQHYDELVSQAAHLERRLGIFGGPFDARPTSWWWLKPRKSQLRARPRAEFLVEHRWPITAIYGASLSVWLAQLLSLVWRSFLPSTPASFAAGCVVASLVWSSAWLVDCSKGQQAKEWNTRVREAHAVLTKYEFSGPNLSPSPQAHFEPVVAAVSRCTKTEEAARARLLFFLPRVSTDGPLGSRLAALVLGQVIDMPPRWIEDISGRRADGPSAGAGQTDSRPAHAPRFLFAVGLVAIAAIVWASEMPMPNAIGHEWTALVVDACAAGSAAFVLYCWWSDSRGPGPVRALRYCLVLTSLAVTLRLLPGLDPGSFRSVTALKALLPSTQSDTSPSE